MPITKKSVAAQWVIYLLSPLCPACRSQVKNIISLHPSFHFAVRIIDHRSSGSPWHILTGKKLPSGDKHWTPFKETQKWEIVKVSCLIKALIEGRGRTDFWRQCPLQYFPPLDFTLIKSTVMDDLAAFINWETAPGVLRHSTTWTWKRMSDNRPRSLKSLEHHYKDKHIVVSWVGRR